MNTFDSNDAVPNSVQLLATSNPKRRAGRKIFNETRHPIYRGVRQRNSNKWVCELREPNKKTRIWLGTFPTVEMAARAHDVAALALRGSSACLNFSDSAWILPVPKNNDPKEIRRAAVEAADMFKPEILSSSGSCDLFEMDVDEFFEISSGALMVEMAEGLMVPPPPYWACDDDQFENSWSSDDVSLWSYSF